jgi:hypothetical protein
VGGCGAGFGFFVFGGRFGVLSPMIVPPCVFANGRPNGM